MSTFLALLKSWVLVNWKTTVLGAVAAVELYQQTGNLTSAVLAFLIGLVASDGKTTHAAPAPVPLPPATP